MLQDAIRWIRSTFISIPLIVLETLAATTLGLALSLAYPKPGLIEWFKRNWARMVLAAGFVHLSVEGGEKLEPGRNYLYCANHLSYFDPPALVVALGRPVRFLAKKSLLSIPLFGWAMRRAGDIAIDRGNPRAASRTLAQAAELARAGASLVIFPEGGRSPDGALQPFLSGAFRLAIQAQIPVVPVAIHGSRDVLPPGSLFIRGGIIRIAIGAPIPTAGLSAQDQDALAALVAKAICQML